MYLLVRVKQHRTFGHGLDFDFGNFLRLRRHNFDRIKRPFATGLVQKTDVHMKRICRSRTFVGDNVDDFVDVGLGGQKSPGYEHPS